MVRIVPSGTQNKGCLWGKAAWKEPLYIHLPTDTEQRIRTILGF